ncbi:S24 family peptidase [Glaesserella parasuis]|uniref:S24 family peptidase n=2 Tax=Glaesserella parasuis TaxID=738 RepID=A0AAJ6ABG5_GLAPU|nr:S24 family peptidase [Glaesserella parasuis]MDD2164754.1 helix-turn-helix transcriptional regulator [Glaesserella parasuis]MDG6274882.1 S24 family peptidase [Glaesserella parasuis]MDG6279072.1 S24 family peptidase [Glaesserella parasuis]MDG6299945.1 S24 family peptidase [Glaesserella parasuis]MDG6312846.1 S24 family peptidase [Glaesserella parasuis]
MIKNMTLPEIRRKKLTEWFSTRDIPEKEKSYISQLKSGKSSFGERAARRLESEYGMPSFYLDYDEETESAIVSAISIQETHSHQYPIHLINFKAKAGETGFINTNYPEIIQSIYFSLDGLLEIVGRKSSNGIEMITIPTDSMAPTINKGDVVFIDTTINYYDNEGVYIFAIDDEVYIKRLQKIPGGVYRALSDNKTYEPFDIKREILDTAIILGKFIRVLPINPKDL